MKDILSEEVPVEKSKTQIKQEMAALQEIGAKIVALKDRDLATVPMEEELESAILEARRIKSREGLRRQMQYIGKLMRKSDCDPIISALEAIENKGLISLKLEKLCETWRDRMLTEGNSAIQQFFEEYPNADFQMIRQLVRNAQREISQEKTPASSRKLFKLLRETINNS